MTMIFSLGSFAAHLVTVEADVKLACDAAVVKASKLVAKTAKNLLGHQQPWPGLQPETIAHKAHGDTPLLETGELRDSISYTAPLHEDGDTVGYVGSNNPKAIWHELGTNHIPPRPFLTIASMGKEYEIHEMMGRMVYGTMVHGGPLEVRHILKHAYHEVTKLGEELVDEGEN